MTCPMCCSYRAISDEHDLIGTFNAHHQLSFPRLSTSKTLKAIASTIAVQSHVRPVPLYHPARFVGCLFRHRSLVSRVGIEPNTSQDLSLLPLPIGLPGVLVGKVGIEPTVYLRSGF